MEFKSKVNDVKLYLLQSQPRLEIYMGGCATKQSSQPKHKLQQSKHRSLQNPEIEQEVGSFNPKKRSSNNSDNPIKSKHSAPDAPSTTQNATPDDTRTKPLEIQEQKRDPHVPDHSPSKIPLPKIISRLPSVIDRKDSYTSKEIKHNLNTPTKPNKGELGVSAIDLPMASELKGNWGLNISNINQGMDTRKKIKIV